MGICAARMLDEPALSYSFRLGATSCSSYIHDNDRTFCELSALSKAYHGYGVLRAINSPLRKESLSAAEL